MKSTNFKRMINHKIKSCWKHQNAAVYITLAAEQDNWEMPTIPRRDRDAIIKCEKNKNANKKCVLSNQYIDN
jgi:hypothetical protein